MQSVEHPLPKDPRFQNLNGRVFGKLTVLFYAGRKSNKYSLWHCLCECNREVTTTSSCLTRGQTKSCVYCAKHQPHQKTNSNFKDLTGQTFGQLTVVSFSHRNKDTNRTYFICQCSCGESVKSRADGLTSGMIQSCGCMKMMRKWQDEPLPKSLQCRKCLKILPMNRGHFYRHPKAIYGFKPICIPCARMLASANYIKNAKKLRMQCLIAYSGDPPKCQCQGCNETILEFLTIDHVDGGGRQHRSKISNTYRWLRMNKFPPGFQVLCMNCNHAKGMYGSCPHAKIN